MYLKNKLHATNKKNIVGAEFFEVVLMFMLIQRYYNIGDQ